MRAQDRARRAGTRPRSDHTLETALSILRDLAVFLADHGGKNAWALADVHDVEAFLAVLPRARKRRLTVLRQFLRFSRSHRLVLVDPTRALTAKEANGFRGRTLTLAQQRELFRRWTTEPDHTPTSPHDPGTCRRPDRPGHPRPDRIGVLPAPGQRSREQHQPYGLTVGSRRRRT